MNSLLNQLLEIVVKILTGELRNIKRNGIIKLSAMLSHSFRVLIVVVFMALALLFASIACAVVLSEVLHSWLWALLIMSVANIILMLIVVPICGKLSNKILQNYFTRLLKK